MTEKLERLVKFRDFEARNLETYLTQENVGRAVDAFTYGSPHDGLQKLPYGHHDALHYSVVIKYVYAEVQEVYGGQGLEVQE